MITHDPRWSLPRGNTLVSSSWPATSWRRGPGEAPELHPGRLHGLRHLTQPASPEAQARETPTLPNSEHYLSVYSCIARHIR